MTQFFIKNSKIGDIASILKPMISKEAVLETLEDTKQLIITDVSTNIRYISTSFHLNLPLS